MPHVARITIHPVKGLGGSEVDAARVTESGALEDDRRWRLVDAEGAVIEPSRWPILKHVHAEFLLASREVFLAIGRHAGVAAPVAGRFTLSPGPDGPGAWLSDCLGTHVSLQERPEGGFPDDPDAPGPTIAAAASLGEVARWFGLPLDDVRRRCPVGIEIGDCDPFWEDTLASPARPGSLAPLGALAGLPADPWGAPVPPEPLEVAIGSALFRAVAVRRLPDDAAWDRGTGGETEHFRPVFEAWRRRRLRRDVDVSAWDGMFRLAVTTIGDGRGGNVQVGDRIDAGRPP